MENYARTLTASKKRKISSILSERLQPIPSSSVSPAVAPAKRPLPKQSQPASNQLVPNEKESEMQPINFNIHRECGDNSGNIEIYDGVLSNLPEC